MGHKEPQGAADLDATLIDALTKYDAVVTQQEELNNLVHKGLTDIVRARLMLDTLEGNELCSDLYPDGATARMKVIVKDDSGRLAVREDTKVANPQAYFARSKDLLSEVQGSFQAVVRAAVRLAGQRLELEQSAGSYAVLKKESG